MSKLCILLVVFALLVASSDPAKGQKGDGCGDGFGCFSAPAGCLNQTNNANDPNQTVNPFAACQFVFKYRINPIQPSIVDFELWGKVSDPSNAYLAIGFGYNEQMPNSSIVMCRYRPAMNIGAIENQYAADKIKPDLVDPADPSIGISNAMVQMVDGEMTCKFSRLAKPPNATLAEKYFDISRPNTYHFLAATGELDDQGMASYHSQNRGSSLSKFDLAESLTGMRPPLDASMVKAHACMMLIAWAFLASIGIMLPRYMKFLFPKRKFHKVDFWFFAHRIIMTCVPIVSLIGFIIICAACGWSWVHTDSTIGFVHSMTGVSTLALTCFQILGGYMRPDKEAKTRPIFNWSHRLMGIISFTLAVVTTAIAFNMRISGKKWALVFVWVVWIVVIPMVYEILDSKRHKVSAVSTGDGVKLEEKDEEGNENLDKMKLVIFVVHFVVQLTITIALMDYILIYN